MIYIMCGGGERNPSRDRKKKDLFPFFSMSSSSYIESVLPHPIGKSYAAQFQAHGFDMPSTLKFITYKDLIDVVQVRKPARYVF